MNEENLIPLSKRTKDAQREIQSLGGKVSAQRKRDKINLRKIIEVLLEKDYEGDNEELLSGAELISLRQLQKAFQGDSKAFEVIRDTAGQKPIEKVEVSKPDSEIINEIEDYVK
jgi:hypothetical protein